MPCQARPLVFRSTRSGDTAFLYYYVWIRQSSTAHQSERFVCPECERRPDARWNTANETARVRFACQPHTSKIQPSLLASNRVTHVSDSLVADSDRPVFFRPSLESTRKARIGPLQPGCRARAARLFVCSLGCGHSPAIKGDGSQQASKRGGGHEDRRRRRNSPQLSQSLPTPFSVQYSPVPPAGRRWCTPGDCLGGVSPPRQGTGISSPGSKHFTRKCRGSASPRAPRRTSIADFQRAVRFLACFC